MKFLVMQIGCIECEVSSYPVKVCETLEEAERVASNHPAIWETEGGDGYMMIIDLVKCMIIATPDLPDEVRALIAAPETEGE